MEPNIIAPPPWSLTGEGIVLLYHFPEEFNRQFGFMRDFQIKGYKGWLGAVMLVEYKTADVGAYFELLYIPGFFSIKGKLTFSVSKIYVSSYDSAWNGRENWGIPKEMADFTLIKRPNGERLYETEVNGELICAAHVKPWSPAVPFSNKMVPLTRIVQEFQEQFLLTRPIASGHIQLAALRHVAAAPDFFPPVHQLQPLATLCIPDFKMTFPQPDVL
ncbi:acetoacetate decarboxylase family protein [Pontibacter brevis]